MAKRSTRVNIIDQGGVLRSLTFSLEAFVLSSLPFYHVTHCLRFIMFFLSLDARDSFGSIFIYPSYFALGWTEIGLIADHE